MADSGFVHDSAELRKLIAENPDLPIVVLVGEYAYSGEWGYEYCSNVSCGVEVILDCEIPFGDGIVPTDKEIFKESLADHLISLPGIEDLTDEEFDTRLKEELAKYEPHWKKVIAICADN